MSIRFKVLIIGAGNIGALYDDSKDLEYLTHGHAFSDHPAFELVGFVDVDIHKAEKASRKWGGKSYGSISEAFNHQKIDVVIVAVPDQYHKSCLDALDGREIKLIVVEKPLADQLCDAFELLELFDGKKPYIMMNYSRRYVPEFIEVRDVIAEGKLGQFEHGHGVYGKGLLHNGSHMLDLLKFWIGTFKVEQVNESTVDYTESDPSVSGVISFENGGQFNLNYIDSNLYTVFELELYFKKGRLRMLKGGLEIELYEVSESDLYKGYKELSLSRTIKTQLDKATYYLSEAINAYLRDDQVSGCKLTEGYEMVKLCTEMIKSARKY